MKKLIFVPVMVLPLLMGCQTQKAPTFSLVEWLDGVNEESQTYFDMEIYNPYDSPKPYGGYRDVDNKVAQIIKENTTKMTLKKRAPEADLNKDWGESSIRYILEKDMGDYWRITVHVREDSLIMWSDGYDKNNEYIEEVTEYSIPKENGKAIIDGVSKRWNEVDNMAEESYQKAYDEASPEAFCSYIENLTVEPSIIYHDKETKDTDHSLLEEIKKLTYVEVDYIFDISDEEETVTYGIEDDFTMSIGYGIFNKESLVQLTKHYYCPTVAHEEDHMTCCSRTYSVSAEKIKVFMEKVQAM